MKTEKLQLAKEIKAFVEKYAKIRADFDPEWDEEEDRFNGPDSAMMAAAAEQLENGEKPLRVHSDWHSGCYKTNLDDKGFAMHQSLVERIYIIIDDK